MSEDLEMEYLDFEDIDAEAEKKTQGASETVKNGPIGEKTTVSAKKKKTDQGAVPAGKRSTAYTGVKKKKRKRNRFKKGLKLYVCILSVIIIAVLLFLWILMFRYQHNQVAEEEEKQAPQEAFEEWYASMTAEDWAENWLEQNPDSSESLASATTYMQSVFGASDVSLYKGRDYTEEAPVFSIRNSDSELARVTLTEKENDEGTIWAVAELSIPMETKTASITVPAGCTVSYGGDTLDETNAVEAESLFDYADLADSLVNPVTWVTYTVDGVLSDSDFTVTTDEDYTLYTNEEGQSYLCLADAELYQTTADHFVRAYLTYYMQGKINTYTNLQSALAYVVVGSQAYNDLVATADGVLWNSYHDNIQIDTEDGEAIVWADNCFSIDITYTGTGTLSLNNGETNEYAATMRVFYTEKNGQFYITNYETL